jgi:hypothetical protein
MSGLKDKLNEMNYDMAAIIHSNSLKKVLGGAEIENITEIQTNTTQTLTDDPTCKERAISKESP